MKRLRVLVVCECSGIVREAFRGAGHDAWSCDMKPAEDGSKFHIQGDALHAIVSAEWDLIIAHPPCTRLALSGVLRLYRGGKKAGGPDPEKWADMFNAAQFFANIFTVSTGTPLAVENPRQHGHARRRHGITIRPQIVHPHHFGDDASKQTCLWLRGLPPLIRTHAVDDLFAAQAPRPRIVGGLPRYSNQTDSGNNSHPETAARAANRSRTFPGIARAMASQWGEFLSKTS